jgi:hypothetical protein
MKKFVAAVISNIKQREMKIETGWPLPGIGQGKERDHARKVEMGRRRESGFGFLFLCFGRTGFGSGQD